MVKTEADRRQDQGLRKPNFWQGTRVLLMENGHVLSARPFCKDMNEVQVEATILEAFPDKIPL